MNIRALTAALLLATLSGCFPATTLAVKENPSATADFITAENYQAVYRKIAPIMRRCNETVWIGDAVTVRAELFTDIRKAELVVEGVNALTGRRVQFLVELEAMDDAKTRVRAWQPIGRALTPAVRKWVEEGYTECGV